MFVYKNDTRRKGRRKKMLLLNKNVLEIRHKYNILLIWFTIILSFMKNIFDNYLN